MHGVTPPSWVMLAYLIAGICFILALRGLSSPASSQRGNRLGMAGMLIAVLHDADPLSAERSAGRRGRRRRVLSTSACWARSPSLSPSVPPSAW
jgi:hypothetical protein